MMIRIYHFIMNVKLSKWDINNLWCYCFHSYVISTLNRLVVDNYIIVYFHSAAPRRSMPGFGWLRRFYQMVDRR